MRSILLILSICCISLLTAKAQQAPCALETINNLQRAINPNFDVHLAQMDAQVRQTMNQQVGAARGGARTISVAVHVVYNTPAENVSTASINNLMNTLNADYSASNANIGNVRAQFQGVIGNPQIQFCLDTIVRRSTSVTCFNPNTNPNGMKSNASGGSTPLDTRYFLNIWIVDLCGNTGGGVAGYAYLPTQGIPGSVVDGLVIDYDLGYNNGNGGTATHEIGHYLGLLHPWGSDNSPSCSVDDGFADTPNTDGPTYSCSSAATSCGVTTQVENFMDYTSCEMMFSTQQANYMNTVLTQLRGTLFNSPGCNSLGGIAPTADFTADRTTVCTTEQVVFSDASTGTPTAWAWTFQGGTPATSAAQNPTVTYNTPGSYTVTLTATNSVSNDTETKTAYITVTNSLALPLVEGFQGAFLPTGWDLVNPDNATTWAKTTNAGGYGTSSSSVFMNNWDYNGGAGQQDLLLTPFYNFTGVNNAELKFDWAYAQYTSTPSPDSLFIIVSPDCGANYFLLEAKGGAGMATVASAVNNNAFVPTAAQWRSDTIDLSPLAGFSNVQFGFLSVSAYGQNLYLDNINISTPVVSQAPAANFLGSPTTISVGGTVNFTDLSTNSPTSWSWNFTGGTPATSTAENPTGIQYNTAGTYAVSLTATNAFGADTETKTAYINVVQGGTGACAFETNLITTDSLRLYLAGPNPGDGFLTGHNVFGDVAKAEKFTGILPNSTVDTVAIYFAVAVDAGAANNVQVRIWDANGTAGSPGTVLGTVNVPINNLLTTNFTDIVFNPPVTVNGDFFVGVEYAYSPGDTIAIVTNQVGNRVAGTGTAWEKQSGGAWYNFNNAAAWQTDLALAMFVNVCEPSTVTLPVANFTASPTAVCSGSSVAFTNTTTNGTTYSWTFPGGTPGTSSAVNPTVTYNTPGTYAVTLVASNGGGSDTETKTGFITVRSKPTPTLTGTNLTCNGGNNGAVSVTVSGGQTPYTYLWTNNATTQNITGVAAGSYSVTVTDANGCTGSGAVQLTQPTAINASTSTTPANCGGSTGSATVSASGGNSPYTFLWSNNATSATINNLLPSTYSVVVTDANGCTASSVAVVGGAQQVSVSLSPTNATCAGNDGAITASASGGSAPYVFNWSNGQSGTSISNLAAGSYTVTVTDANACSATANVALTAPAAITLNFSTNAAGCGLADGSATVSATGGNGNYTYTWSNNGSAATINNVAAGSYSVTVSDGSCTVTGSASVNNVGGPTVTIPTFTNVSCAGGSNGNATASATGGTGVITYAWSSGSQSATANNLTAGTYTVSATDANSCVAVAIVTITQPTQLTLGQSTVTNVSCFGSNNGAATVSANGGTPGYTYNWPGGLTGATRTGLAAGSYTVTVTDANTCSATTTVNVSAPAELTVSLSRTNPGCTSANGSITASVSGGVAGYTYSWTGGGSGNPLTGLAAGSYIVTVTDANSCTATATISLSNTSGPTVAVSATPVSCGATANGTATASASGGTQPYTYQWTDGNAAPAGTTATINNLNPGTYNVTVTDAASCASIATVTVGSLGPAVAAVVTNVSGCVGNNNGAVSLTVSGGQLPYSYSWSNGSSQDNIAALTAGSYSVTVVDNANCTTIQTYTITQPSAVSVNVSVTNASTTTATDGEATVNPAGGTPPYTIAWSSGATGTTASNLAAGTYTVAVTDANNCAVTETFTVAGGTVGIADVAQQPVISIYPNPNEGRFTVDVVLVETGDVQLEVYSTIGKLVFSEQAFDVKETKMTVDLADLPPAAYYVKFSSGEHNLVRKVLKLNQ